MLTDINKNSAIKDLYSRRQREKLLQESLTQIEEERIGWNEQKVFLQEKIKFLQNEAKKLVKKEVDAKLEYDRLKNDFESLVDALKSGGLKSSVIPDAVNQNFSSLHLKSTNNEPTATIKEMKNINQELKNKLTNQARIHQTSKTVMSEKIRHLQERMHYYKAENKFLRDSLARRNVGM